MMLLMLLACAAKGPPAWRASQAAPLATPAGLAEAREDWREACERGVSTACTDLHRSEAWRDDPTAADLEEAWWSLLDLCREQHIDACRALGMTWRRGQGRDQDIIEADYWFDHARQRGDGKAAALVGHGALVAGEPPLDPREAKRWFEDGCHERGAPLACAELHGRTMAEAQLLGQRNAMEAADVLAEDCNDGRLASCVILARAWMDGVAGERRPERAADLLAVFDDPATIRWAELEGIDPYAGEALLLLRRASGVEPSAKDRATACSLGMEPACP